MVPKLFLKNINIINEDFHPSIRLASNPTKNAFLYTVIMYITQFIITFLSPLIHSDICFVDELLWKRLSLEEFLYYYLVIIQCILQLFHKHTWKKNLLVWFQSLIQIVVMKRYKSVFCLQFFFLLEFKMLMSSELCHVCHPDSLLYAVCESLWKTGKLRDLMFSWMLQWVGPLLDCTEFSVSVWRKRENQCHQCILSEP